MSKFDKLVEKLLRRTSGANFAFDDLRYVLLRLGFDEDINGSHHTYTRDDLDEQPNLQRYRGRKDAKPYQVRQVRDFILKHRLIERRSDD